MAALAMTWTSSGAACPGLIEASSAASASLWRTHPHPGLLAPASLKRPHHPARAGGAGSSSGAACPGLIEAEQGVKGTTKIIEPHPGLLAPASLKRLAPGGP